jgi:hypothetical protein
MIPGKNPNFSQVCSSTGTKYIPANRTENAARILKWQIKANISPFALCPIKQMMEIQVNISTLFLPFALQNKS